MKPINEMTLSEMTSEIEEGRKAQAPRGPRCVLVVDRGWIFAGDLSEHGDYVRLDRAVHVFGWSGIGFAKMIELGAASDTADLRPCAPVEVPKGSIIFRVPVSERWGLK